MAEAASRDSKWLANIIVWRKPNTWMSVLSEILFPIFRRDGGKRLRPGIYRDICYDDPDWLNVLQRSLLPDLCSVVDLISASLEHATMRTYHGCRTLDAGSYFRDGLRTQDRTEMLARLEELFRDYPQLNSKRDRVEAEIRKPEYILDTGRLYVAADDATLLERAPHYLIYGSEWILGALGSAGHDILRSIGTPTLLEINLPLRLCSVNDRNEMAGAMLKEWTRFQCNKPDYSAPLDFTFQLDKSLPPSFIVGHSHPASLLDRAGGGAQHNSHQTTCKYCE